MAGCQTHSGQYTKLTVGIFTLVLAFVIPSHSPLAGYTADKDYVLEVDRNEIKIMSYNVQNLFNATHDRNKNDYEFLPAKHDMKEKCGNNKYCLEIDWTDEKVEMKLDTIKEAVSAQGPLPDILVLSEVENKEVVGRLAERLGYKNFEMTTSPDSRGIDCAILYKTTKLELLEYIERPLEGLNFASRNLSAAVFSVETTKANKGVLAVFANHWPSQGRAKPNPRLTVAAEVRAFVSDLSNEYKKSDFHYLLTGDFNVIDEESPHPIDDVLLEGKDMYEVRKLAVKLKHPLIKSMPPATYYYGVEDTWNEFDRFFISKSLYDESGFDVDVMSYRIHAPSFLTKKDPKAGTAVPYRYNHKTDDRAYAGYSDHFAIVLKLGFY